MEKNSKQVIVMRNDLGMRKGKMIAQGAHASLAALFDATGRGRRDDVITIDPKEGTALHHWLTERFTKICVRADSEAQLLEIYQQAKEAGLPCALITDAGLTEFNNVPTKTCLAIGPCWDDEVDHITKELKLL